MILYLSDLGNPALNDWWDEEREGGGKFCFRVSNSEK